MANRTDVIGGVWAEGAPDPPSGTTPSAGTTYADSTLTESEINTAWPYSQKVDSATHNEIMKRVTTLLIMLEQQGIMTYCAATEYALGALVLGSDGFLYRSIQASNTGHDPKSSPTYWVANSLYGVAGGSVNAYTLTLVPPISILSTGLVLWVSFGTANTAASTLNVNSIGNIAVKWLDGTDVQAGMLSGLVSLVYDGTYFRVLNSQVHAQSVQRNSLAYTSTVSYSSGTLTYSATYAPAIAAAVDGMKLAFKVSDDNTGPCLFSPNGIASKKILSASHELLSGGMLTANGDAVVIYNSSADSGTGAWILLNSTGGNQSGYDNPVYPEVLTSDGELGCTGSTGQVVVDPSQYFVMRGLRKFYTSDFDAADRTFALNASKTYHLRFVGRIAGTTAFATFYAAKGIVDNTFYVIDVTDADYNAGSLAETDSSFDSQYDDMLIATITTDPSSGPTLIQLSNKNRLKYVYSGTTSLTDNATYTTLHSISDLNWARTPESFPVITALQSFAGTPGNGSAWSSGYGTLAQVGIQEAAGPTRYGGSLNYCYQDSEANQGAVSYRWVFEA